MYKLNWGKAIIAGIVGTILFDLFGLITTGQWWDIPGLLGQKTGLGMFYGVIGHYANGMLISILYAAVAPHLWGPYWARAILFIVGETIALVWFFMLPFMGAGVAGIENNAMMPLMTVLRHLVYAVALIFIVNPDIENQLEGNQVEA